MEAMKDSDRTKTMNGQMFAGNGVRQPARTGLTANGRPSSSRPARESPRHPPFFAQRGALAVRRLGADNGTIDPPTPSPRTRRQYC